MSSGHFSTFSRSLVVKLSRWARDDFTNKKTLKRMLVSEMKVGQLVRLQDVLMAVDAEDTTSGITLFRILSSVRLDPSIHLDAYNYSLAISACTRQTMWREACILFQQMHQGRVKPDVVCFGALMSCYQKAFRWQMVLEILKEMPRPNVFCYSTAMTSCEKADRWQQALELFKTMRTIRIETDVVSYAAAISSCGKMGKWKEALQFCDEMFSTKVQHNLISYSAVINAVEKGNEWKKALMMFDLMPFLRLVPSAITYGSALSACDSASQWQQALSLWLEAKEAQVTPDAIAYSVTISSCGKAAQWQHALWFLQMRHAEIVPASS